MRALIVSVSRHRRILAALTVALVLLLAPSRAQAQELYWDDELSQTFKTFGPNQSVDIAFGTGGGICGGIVPVVHVYVVNVSVLQDGDDIVDVSNPGHVANTFLTFSGGLFTGTIAQTYPSGQLGPGTYGVVYKRCLDDKFHADEDAFFYPAFEVVIPANIMALPPSFTPLKQFAEAAMPYWAAAKSVVEAYEKLQELKAAIECLQNLVGCAVDYAVNSMIDYAKAQVMAALGLRDPKAAAKQTAIDMFSHYAGIAADPPDPNFQQVTTLGPVARITEISDDPILQREFELANAAASHSAILAALLHAVERYQGAEIAGDSTWALVHAREIKAYSAALAAQLPSTSAAASNLRSAFAADTRDLDGLAAAIGPMHAQMVSSGFTTLQLQALSNLGASPSLIANLRSSLAAEPVLSFNKANTLSDLDGLIATNTALASFLPTFMADIDVNIATLLAPPNFQGTRPFANAGGPYTAAEGASFALNGTASFEDGGAITAYAWDLDGDGQFDDAVGATPTVSVPFALDGFIGLQVSDAGGNTSVAYAHVTITDVNHAPVIAAVVPVSPQPDIIVGSNQAFTVTASDPDGDALSFKWLVDFAEVGTGLSSYLYSPVPGDVGVHTLRVEVSDATAAGGTVTHEWSVSVLTADGDGDGWNSNADCNDGNAAIHPLGPEIIGNGIDDDCRADTLDGGTPPVAGFSHGPSPALVGELVSFTDTSTDPDSPTLLYAWSFGDGATSSVRNPTHAYAATGTFTVSLTVTDPQLFTSTATGSVVVTHAPTAAFTFSPNPGTRTLPVAFTNTSSDPDGPLASYQWSFGDGGISSDQNPTHTYDTAGTFPVQLTVTDAAGVTASFGQSITINPAPTDVTSLKFVVYETNCGYVPIYNFRIGGVTVGSMQAASDCTCSPGAKTLTVTDPAILAMVSSPVCQVFDIESAGTIYYFGSAHVEITRPSGVQSVRIVNTNSSDGPDVYSGYACSAYVGGGPLNYQSQLPNLDGDAVPDCTDPDIDGDGTDNVADNCPLIPNPTQADFNSNGFGDACEDSDGDTRIDAADNCQAVANTNQWDFDHDGTGNACDTDADGDGVLNTADNCPYLSNATQLDADGNGHGDVCDIQELRFRIQKSTEGYATTTRILIDNVEVGTLAPEPAGGYCNVPAFVVTITDPEVLALLGAVPTCNQFKLTTDNWLLLSWAKAEMTHYSGAVDTVVIHDKTGGSFPQQACYAWESGPTFMNDTPDTDGDGIYNCEDPDMDADGVLNAADNCPLVTNPGQEDVDSNGVGNACQDTDADGVLDINDNCPVLANSNQSNIDGDSQGDACDLDRDNDTILNAADNCADNPNTNQSDIDADLVGDVCDADMDGDSVGNGSDNCPTTVNPNQRNTDGDSVGDACDPDIDNDAVLNAADNCLYVANADQASTNPYGVGDACVPRPITIPWLGVATQPHQVYSGGSLVLQGIAVYDGSYAPADILSAVWDPGDGSPAQSVSVADPMALELTHTYTGADQTPFTAVLTITMLNGATRSDEFRVLIQPRTIDVEANMAIDRGLWNLHKSRTATTVTGVAGAIPAYYWTGSDTAAASAATINAFGINNHKINGNRDEDPYVEDVRRGLAFLETQISAFAISMQPAGDPDTNGNGIGLQNGQQVYVTGQIADAFVAAAQQTSVAVSGDPTWIRGRRHRDIVQDIMDAYWFGQSDIGGSNRGGWHYGWNYGSADNSTAQWGAITGLAGENAWDIPVPQWVRDENILWVRSTQFFDPSYVGQWYYGAMTYSPLSCVWSNCMATTPSGMVQMDFDGVRNNPAATDGDELRFQEAIRFMARAFRSGWHTSDPSYGNLNYYALFAAAKAFRLAVDTDGSGNLIADPVVVIDDNPADTVPGFDWYRNDPLTPSSDSPMGVARALISRQNASGSWPDAPYWAGSLATAYSVIILSPTIFELGPAAMCSAVPSIAGAGDTVSFDGSGSIHNDPFGQIASYTWDFQDGTQVTTTLAPTSTTTHAFGALGTYNVLLTVTDTNGITAAASCPVQIIDGNRPPIANAGGPYHFCAGSPMVLNASGSTDPEGGALSFAWDLSSPLTFSNIDGTTAVFDATSFLGSLMPGIYQIALRVTDDHAHASSVFPNITIHAAGDPDYCNTPPVLTLPANLTTYATSAAGAQVSYTVTASDPQQGNIAPVCTPASNTMFAIGTTTVACTATDAYGLTDTGSFTVTVLNNPPVFTPPANIERAAITASGVAVSFDASGNDIEDGVIPAVCVPASGSNFPIGSTTVNCTVTDSRGAAATGSFLVNVTPPTNVGPTFTPPANITTTTTNAGGTAVSFTATGTDLEDGPIPAVCAPAAGSTFTIGTTTVSCTVTDSGGLSASGSFTVTVDLTVSNQPPTFTPPANITTTTSNAGGTAVSFTATGTDLEDGLIPAVCAPAAGSTFSIGTTTVSCTVTDSGGLSASGSFTVTVDLTVSNHPPTFTPPANITRQATSPAGAAVTFAASGSDVEDGTIAAVCVPPSGSTFPLGVTTVSCTVTDSDGLSASGSFNVTVTSATGNKPPIIVAEKVTVHATSPAGAKAFYAVTATDREDGPVGYSCTPPSGSMFPIGTTQVPCTATDSGGLSTTVSFKVVVLANERPRLTVPLDKITVQAKNAGGKVATFAASANDAEDGPLAVTCTPASGSLFPVGTTRVTCSATDSYGATSTATFKVIVLAP